MSDALDRVRSALDIANRQPERVVGLRGDPVGPAQDVEVVDEGRAHIGRQRVEEARDRHAQHLGLGAVDVGEDLRGRGVEQRKDLDEAGRPVGRADDAVDRLFERARAAAGAVLHVELEAAAGADARHRGRRDHQDEGLAQRLHLAAQIVEDGFGLELFLHPLFERLQGDEKHARIRRVGEGRAVEAREGHGVGDARAAISRISEALRMTASVRSRLEPGGKVTAVMK